jgi:hypothetical protein
MKYHRYSGFFFNNICFCYFTHRVLALGGFMKKLFFFIVAFLCPGTCNTLVAGSPKILEFPYRFAALRDLYQAARGTLLDEVGENAPLLARLDSTYAWLHDFLPIPKSYRSEHKAFDALLKIARAELSPETSHTLIVLQRAGKKKLGLTVGAKVGIGVAVWVAATVVATASLLYFLNKIGNAPPLPQMHRLPDMPYIFVKVVENNREAVERELTRRPDHIHCVDEDSGMTPLHMAALGGYLESMKELLKKKVFLNLNASVNVKDCYGSTPLHLAAAKGHIEAVKILLAHGALVDAKDENAKTPLERAREGNHDEVVECLEGCGMR